MIRVINTLPFANTLESATHCNTRQHTATGYVGGSDRAQTRSRCNTLQHTATHCNTPQHTATHRVVKAGSSVFNDLQLVGSLKLYVSFAKEP